MIQRALLLALLASVFLVPARADFAAGQRACDAGRERLANALQEPLDGLRV